jgi:alpha-L-rhamnosidase
MERTWTGIWIKAYSGYASMKPLQPSPYMRTVFHAPEKVQSAIVHLCALGVHQLYINDQIVDGDSWYKPALSQYDCRAGYLDYDVKKYLKPGKNVLIVQLGNGFYNAYNNWMYTTNYVSWRGAPRMICDVEIDGKIIEFSGVHWRVHSSPITFDCHHEGEDYDARLELPECFKPDYDASHWQKPVRTVPPGGIIELENVEPRRVIQRIQPIKVTQTAANRTVFDFGINCSGVVEISVKGESGTVLTIRYGEMLDGFGNVDTRNVDYCQQGARFETDRYTLKGGGEVETWHPQFVWHGFRYVEITSSKLPVEVCNAVSLFISTDFPVVGHFHSSNDVLNRIQEITLTSYRSNFMGIPTDCPTREKFGWTGDAETAIETGWWNFNPRKGLEQLQKIIMDLQRADGTISTHGPTTLYGFEECSPSYSAFLYDFCHLTNLFTGDDTPIRTYYPKLKKTVHLLESMSRDDCLFHVGYGDWCHPLAPQGGDGYNNQLDPTLVESALFVYILELMADFANVLKQDNDQQYFSTLRQRMIAKINECFYDRKAALYDNQSRAGTAMVLYFGIAPAEERQRIADALAQLVRRENHRVLDGIQGAKFVPRALAEYGYAEDALQMIIQPEYPGWGNLVKRGASSLWENWKGNSSLNHIMFGDVSAWMYRYLAGMTPTAPGFRKVRIKPCFVAQLSEVSATHQTPFGTIEVAWRREQNAVTLEVNIPQEITADVFLPQQEYHGVTGKKQYQSSASSANFKSLAHNHLSS